MASQLSPHVVVIPSPTAGHAIPFLHFAQNLAAAHVTTTFVCTDRYISELKASLAYLDFTSQGSPLRFSNLREGSAHLTHREYQFAVLESRDEEERMVKLLAELIEDISSPESQKLRGVPPAAPPVVILHDMFTSWCQQVGDHFHLEKHMLFVSSTAALSVELQSKRLDEEGFLPLTPANRDTIISSIPGVPPTRTLDLPASMIDPNFHKWMKYNHYRYRNAKVFLANTFYDLEKHVLDALRQEVLGLDALETESILDIGPVLPESHLIADDATVNEIIQDARKDKDPCILFLDTQSPSSVIYVAFGSFATTTAAQLLDVAWGLEASNQPFLWILRPPNLPYQASGPRPSLSEFLPPGFEERMKGRGMCYSGWAPQMQILKHPATGGFLSHCGWNSVLESTCAGVPFLTWPFDAEQHLNARFLVDIVKLGLELQREELESNSINSKQPVSKEEIKRKVRSLMQEEEGKIVRENTRKMRLNAKKAVAEGGSSRKNFETYVQLLHAKASLASQANS